MSQPIDALDYRAALVRETDLLARVARTDLRARVTHCPDWDLADLVAHVIAVFEFWHAIGTRAVAGPEDYEAQPRVPDDELAARLVVAADALATTVYPLDPAIPVWSWSAQKNVGFIHRRMAQEITVHRWNGEQAVGDTTPIEPTLATDGIDEFLRIHLPADPDQLVGALDRVCFATTDTNTSWTVDVGGDRVE
ncbi:MAG: maleylpyruvate isomerase N-terminal domain-containing protein, partial [Acidimicrobiia bacterium]